MTDDVMITDLPVDVQSLNARFPSKSIMTPPQRRSSSSTHPGTPDLILVNARVLTLEDDQPTAEALAIYGDRIAAVGRTKAVAPLAGPGTRIIDCRGRTLIPGFVDAHCHLLAQATALSALDCSPRAVNSIEELQELVRRKADAHTAGQWIRGVGYDDLSLSQRRHPTRYDLDSVSRSHPVRLEHRSSHAVVLNSLALQIAGIDDTTPDPVEGVIDRDPATGRPTGLLLELSRFLRDRLGPSRDSAQLEADVAALDRCLLSCGITSVQDAGANNGVDRWLTLQSLQASGKLSPRVTMMAGASNLNELASAELQWGGGGDMLRLGHAKIMLTLTTGALHPNEQELKRIVEEAHNRGFPVAIHAIEQEAIEASVQVLEEAPFEGGLAAGRRDRIEHCAECPPHLMARIRDAGVTVVTQPGFIYWNGDGYLRRVASSMLPHLYPASALLEAFVPLAFSSDGPVIDANPWPGIYSAVTGNTRECNTLPPGSSSRTPPMTVMEALRCYTLGGAYSEGTEHLKGSLRVGKLADLALLDSDPTTVGPERLREIKAVMTVVGGRVVWGEDCLI